MIWGEKRHQIPPQIKQNFESECRSCENPKRVFKNSIFVLLAGGDFVFFVHTWVYLPLKSATVRVWQAQVVCMVRFPLMSSN